MADPVTTIGTQDQTPVATMGFGAREDADTTRQAQHMEANDAPVDVNMNAIMARSQALTVDALGKSFAANEDFRQKLQDRILAKMPA
jgi:hypothetical protein